MRSDGRTRLAGVEPLDRATIWPYRDGEPGELYYQRYAHPNGVAAERKLGELEGGHALLFPSGTGARDCARARVPRTGPDDRTGRGRLLRDGRASSPSSSAGAPPRRVRPDRATAGRAELVWLEAPSNPFLTMPDLEAAVAAPPRVVVDSTAATPSTCGRSSTAPTSPSTARRSSSAGTTTCCWVRSA